MEIDNKPKRIGSFYIGLFLIILLFIAVFVNFHNFAKVRESRAAKNWADTFGSIEDLPNQYPYRNDNEAAIRLKGLAVRLGINFNVDGEGHRYSPSNSDAERLKRLHRDYAFWRYFGKQLGRRDDLVDPAFPSLAKYLADYRKRIEDVRDYVLAAPPIFWRQNLQWTKYGYPDAASPSISAISELQRIMSARVLELTADHNYPEAERYLEAQWKLNESLKSRCDLETQQKALRIDTELLSLTRKLPLVEEWIAKIAKHDYEKAYMKGFTIEAWFLWRERNEYKMTKNPALNNILDPYLRTGLSSQLENETKDLQRLQTMNPCDLGYKEFRESGNSGWDKIPWNWRLYDKISTYAEITEIQLLRELTGKVIKVRHGYFPQDGIERSKVCKDGSWEYWRSSDGSTTIKYKGRIELPRTPPAGFPSSFTVNVK